MNKKKKFMLYWPGGGTTYTQKVIALSPIAYWPQAEASGTTIVDESGNSRNGTYTAVTLGATGIGDGRTAATFDGSTSKGDVFSAGLAAAINGSEGTLALWLKVAVAGVWSDATARQLGEFGDGANNRFVLSKSNGGSTLIVTYKAGGTTKSVNVSTSSTAWLHFAMTWSKSADQMIAYFNGAQSGATQTALGTWGATPTRALIGAFTTVPANVWNGTIAHTVIFGSALSAAQILTLATVP